MLVQDLRQEYQARADVNLPLIIRRKNDVVFYHRKKPTKKQKTVQKFLDKSYIPDNLDSKELDQKLSHLYDTFDLQQRVRARRRLKRKQKRDLNLSLQVPKRTNINPLNQTDFVEYEEYLELFCEPTSNIRNIPKPKVSDGKNAELFIKVYTEHREKLIETYKAEEEARLLREALELELKEQTDAPPAEDPSSQQDMTSFVGDSQPSANVVKGKLGLFSYYGESQGSQHRAKLNERDSQDSQALSSLKRPERISQDSQTLPKSIEPKPKESSFIGSQRSMTSSKKKIEFEVPSNPNTSQRDVKEIKNILASAKESIQGGNLMSQNASQNESVFGNESRVSRKRNIFDILRTASQEEKKPKFDILKSKLIKDLDAKVEKWGKIPTLQNKIKLSDYHLDGNKRRQHLQVSYYHKKGLLEVLKAENAYTKNAKISSEDK